MGGATDHDPTGGGLMVIITLIVGVMSKQWLRKSAVPFTLIMLLFGVAFGVLIESGECVLQSNAPCVCGWLLCWSCLPPPRC